MEQHLTNFIFLGRGRNESGFKLNKPVVVRKQCDQTARLF